ncbi:hypothetical protein [Nodularia spumigena]|jgi:hypothetical protein|uniref:hypothetical protein n=1 Tax=Nodularia spumigena TaxID=70799 RepID=UPI002B21FF7E|nr:hypothetical protein [Nodularia spumigena]
MNMVNIAIDCLKNQGFENIKAIDPDTTDVPVSKPIYVTDLDGNSNFTIVPLDASATKEFYDIIYVAIKGDTNELLEVASISKSPKIYNDQEIKSQLKQKFPENSVEIIPGYFWKSELRSFLSTVRCFKTGNKEMFLLPNGNTTDDLNESTMGG